MKFGPLRDEEMPGKWHVLIEPMYVDLRPEFEPGLGANEAEFHIPEGFRTDFASMYVLPIPRKWLIDTEKPAVLHDWQYRHGKVSPKSELGISREMADEIFHAGMRAEGISEFRAWSIWCVVRLTGWAPWRRYRGKG